MRVRGALSAGPAPGRKNVRRGPRLFHAPRAVRHALAGTALGLVLALAVLAVDSLGLWDRMEWRALDWRFLARFLLERTDAEAAPVVVVAVDDRSVEALGPWPWPLSVQADLVAALQAAGATVVGLDYLLSSPHNDPAGTQRLARAMAQGPVVLAAAAQGVFDVLPPEDLAAQAAGVGRTGWQPDADGVVRRLHLRPQPQPQPFALAVARAAGLAEEDLPASGTVLLNYRPPANASRLKIYRWVPTVSAADVLDGLVGQHVAGRVALVGLTASGAADRYNTPFTQGVPDVYLQAFAVRAFLTGDHVAPVPAPASWLAVVLLAVFGGAWVLSLRPWFLTATAPLAAGAAAGAALWLFLEYGLWLRLTPLLVVIAGHFVAGLVYAYWVVDRDTHRIRSLFQRYVAPEVVDRLLQDPKSFERGQRAHVTVLFADVRGFTGFAERVSPEEAVGALNRCLEAMADAVLSHGGMLDKYIGDAVMAVFGAPLARDDHAQAAVAAAVELRRRIDRLALAADAGAPLRVGIGVHTGVAVVGSVGSPQRREYTAIGDAVNVASRLEEAAGPGEILISESTLQACGLAPPGPGMQLGIRGRRDPVVVFRLDDVLLHAVATARDPAQAARTETAV